ncbi:hypothetical protein [Halorarius litoreus]|uniref:hypothetical protein n=1 Tax=Halorarius litoreus TaxID=2962676 RepID=UPI0020CC6488|nr:hypothetical protein [Halorarius litoreus]
MAFDNVTFFELHLDGARFGSETAESADEPVEMEVDDGSGRRGFPIGFLVVLGIGAIVAARRMRRGKDIELDLEDAEAIAVE